MNAEQRLELTRRVADWCYDNTGSWAPDRIGLGLASLFWAIAADDLRLIGIRRVRDLQGKNPEKLYAKLCKRTGRQIDRCALYVFRCAVYFASRKKHDPAKLKWWNWKDRQPTTSGRTK